MASTGRPERARPPSRLSQQSSQAAETQSISDAILHTSYDQAEAQRDDSFDYRALVPSVDGRKPWEVDQVAYLARMQRSGLTQPHGAMLVVEPHATNLEIMAYSDNCAELFELDREAIQLGKDARGFFSEASAMLLLKECGSKAAAFRQPLVVELKPSKAPFYAILNRCETGVILDLEPVVPADRSLSIAGNDYLPKPSRESPVALTLNQCRQAAAHGVSRLQSAPSGDVDVVCQTVVCEMRDLVQYDRVMVYKFHPDQHGEVVAESVREDLEPYLGLHFPSTDIPQAMRTLFIRVGCRMICNASRPMVKVVQVEDLEAGVNLSDSTLRAPHGCHAQYMCNMGSMASLTMAVLIDDKKDDMDPHESVNPEQQRLWGLVVCHHCSPRYTPFPLRKAAEYLMQKFGTVLNKELLLAANLHEEKILATQTRLCDMLESDVPLGIIRDTPNILDLVKCDGAALYFANRFWVLGVTPTEKQVGELVQWLATAHKKKTAICTDSLAEAGFPQAAELGDRVCGMVAIKLRVHDYVFWFRGHTAKEVRWGGRRQVAGEKDDGRKMLPRNSFQAFLDVVKKRSMPWDDVELEAINSLRLMLKSALDLASTESMHAALVDNLEGGTDIEGKPLPVTGLRIRLSHELPLTLSEETEVILKCFKASFVVTDATREDYPVIFCSEAFTLLTGYTEADIRGNSFRKLEGPDTDDAETTKMKASLDCGSTYTGRQLHYRKDDTCFWDLVTMAPVKNSAGEIRYHVILYQEVAKYSESQTGSPKSPDQAASPSAQKGFPVSLIRYDGRLKEKSVRKVLELVQAIKNPARAKTDGPLTPGRLGGIAGELKIPMPDSPEFGKSAAKAAVAAAAAAAAAAAGPEPPRQKPTRRRSVVDIILGKPGKEEPLLEEAKAPRSASQDDSLDAEARRDSAKKRRAHRGIDFGTTLERIEYNFLVTDPRLDENPVIFMSDEYIRLTEYTREEYIGGPIILLEGHETSTVDIRKIRTAIQNTKDVSVQLNAYKRSGRTFWVVCHLSMVKDSDGHVLYIIKVLQDCGGAKLEEAAFKRAVAKSEAESSKIREALLDLPDAATEEKHWTIHSQPVLPKPHKYDDPAWAAIKKVKAQEGRLGLKHFRPVKPLGNGDSGSVMLVELRGTGQFYAVKVMEKERMIERNKVHRVAAEREILEHLDHPFLPTLYASFQTAKHVCFVTDYCPGGELYDLLEAQPEHLFDEEVACFYAAEILLSLEYLHCQGVLYRDLKPENVLLTASGHALLTDFDLSVLSHAFPKVIREATSKKSRRSRKPRKEQRPTFVAEPLTRSNSFVGTEEYIAPEIVTGAGHTASVDWWAFGIFLYEMLFGRTPFCGSSMRKTFANVLHKDLYFPSAVKVSLEAKHLLRQLLIRDPERRLGSQKGAAEIKTHPFFAAIDWPLIRSKRMPAPKVPASVPDILSPEDIVEDKASATDTWRIQDTKTGSESERTSGTFVNSSSGDLFNSSRPSSSEFETGSYRKL
uniref:non-specific serine/threonine protein kinase n=1 Tax=Zygnemopsis sp. MFZO TaxID=1498957 RepID=A0A059UG98_9VIRI|nr:neochrome [Zygnemopsis sp. MFZO]